MSEKSDLELEFIRQKKLREMMKHLEKRGKDETEKTSVMDARRILDGFFVDRAWEVLNAAKAQYPEVANYIENLLVKLIMEGKIREKISGEELYGLFLRLGFRVKLSTRIQIVEHGKIKSLEEKIKEETG